MRTFFTLLLIAISFHVFAIQKETNQNGNWTSSSTWKNGLIPSINDTVILNHEISINIDSIQLNFLQINANVKFNNSYLLKVKFVEINSSSTISSNYFIGSIQVDSILKIKAVSTFNNVDLNSKGECIISALLQFTSENSSKIFKNIYIQSGGCFNNSTNSDPHIYGNIKNDGKFVSCKASGCTYHIHNDCTFSGDSLLSFTRIETENNKQLLNLGQLAIQLSLNGNPKLINQNKLFLNTSSQAFHPSEFNTSYPNNTVIYTDTNEQSIYSTSSGSYQNLQLKNGRKILENNLFIKQKLELLDSAVLAQQTFYIDGLNNAELNIDSTSSLSIGSNDFYNSNGFPVNFKKLNLHSSSTVIYQSKGNENINSSIPYGNLVIDDGAVTESIKTIDQDSLRIRGNLWIAESSVKLKCNDCNIHCNGDWDGIGNLEMTKGIFEIKGNGNNYGKLIPGSGTVLFNGLKNQNIKIGDYHKLIINKPSGKALLRGNVGVFRCKTMCNEKGILEIGNETVTITDSLINYDQLYFTSNQQNRTLKNLINQANAQIQFKVATNLNVKGNWINNGTFNGGSGKVTFNDSIQTQTIKGTNTFNILEINKKHQSISLENDIQIMQEIKITSGKFNLKNHSLLLATIAKINGENEANYIYGNNGKIILNKSINAVIKDSVNGIGLIIEPTVNWGSTQFVRKHFIYNIDGDNSIRRQFEIHPTNDSNMNEKVSFFYLPHELESNKKNLLIYKSKDELFWKKMYGRIDTAAKFIVVDSIKSFSTWTFKSLPENPLPLTWLSLDIIDDQIIWKTASELNTDYFLVQHSSDGINFENSCTTLACGSCNYINTYNCLNEISSNAYYRIKCIDKDGSESFSSTLYHVANSKNCEIKNDGQHLQFDCLNSKELIEIFDSNGKLVLSKKVKDFQLNESPLPNGIYFYRLKNQFGKIVITN